MQPKVSVAYTLTQPGDEGRHKFGINALDVCRNPAPQAAWAGSTSLFTAGRDSKLRRWDVSALDGAAAGRRGTSAAHPLTCVATYEDHSDWVNDVVVASQHGLLLSASSDHTLKLWPLDAREDPAPRTTVRTHTDYVKRLCYSAASGLVASASLDKMIHIFNIDSLRVHASTGGDASGGGAGPGVSDDWSSDGSGPAVAAGHQDSVYALAMNEAGSLIASGSVEPEIRLWDARTGRKQMKLPGHSDVVRALRLDAEGRMLVSASSDRTVRLWDLASPGRCMHAWRVHRDAAWALEVDAAWRTLYSAGRDGRMYAHSLVDWSTVVLAREAAPVVGLRLGTRGTHLWAATTRSDLRAWTLEGVAAALEAGGNHPSAAEEETPRTPREFAVSVASPSPTQRYVAARPTARGAGGDDEGEDEGPPPLERAPLACIEGADAIQAHAILTDRWRVLTVDIAKRVTLWDVLRGVVLRRFGNGRKLEDVEKELNAERAVPSWFTVDTRSGDLTIVLDERTAFAGLLYADDVGLAGDGVAEDATINLGWNVLSNVFGRWVDARARGGGDAARKKAAAGSVPLVVFEAPPEAVRVSLIESGRVAARTTAAASASLPEHKMPHWVSEALLAHRFYSREKAKVPFYVVPDASQSLPGLKDGASRLEALRILRMRQVIKYVGQNLSTPMEGAPLDAVRWEDHIEITCNDRLLAPHVDLYSARLLVWKNPGEDMVLVYRRKAVSPSSMPTRMQA